MAFRRVGGLAIGVVVLFLASCGTSPDGSPGTGGASGSGGIGSGGEGTGGNAAGGAASGGASGSGGNTSSGGMGGGDDSGSGGSAGALGNPFCEGSVSTDQPCDGDEACLNGGGNFCFCRSVGLWRCGNV